MPNWCYTQIKFHGEINEIRRLCELVEKSTEKDYSNVVLDSGLTVPTNGFGRNWLGNCLAFAGIDPLAETPDRNEKLRCRGEIVDWGEIHESAGEGELCVLTETAWIPMCRMWQEIIVKLGLKTVKFSFCAEEQGCGLFWIFDPDGTDAYDEVRIDMWTEDGMKFSEDMEKLIAYLSLCEEGCEYLPFSVVDDAVRNLFPGKTVQEVVDKINEENENVSIMIAEYVEEGEFD